MMKVEAGTARTFQNVVYEQTQVIVFLPPVPSRKLSVAGSIRGAKRQWEEGLL